MARTALPMILALVLGSTAFGQSISLTGSTYTQDFNTLAISGTSSTVPTGWAFSEAGTNANTTYTGGTGSSNTGDTYSFGVALSAERAFGGLLSGNLIPTIGASFTNDTGSTLTEILVAYTGEQWRLGATGRTDRLDFQYSLDATSLTTGTWIDFDALDFNAPVSTGAVGALDGNLNSLLLSSTITGLNIDVGTTFWIRWSDFNATGGDDGLGVDVFSLSTSVPEPGSFALVAVVAYAYLRFRKKNAKTQPLPSAEQQSSPETVCIVP